MRCIQHQTWLINRPDSHLWIYSSRKLLELLIFTVQSVILVIKMSTCEKPGTVIRQSKNWGNITAAWSWMAVRPSSQCISVTSRCVSPALTDLHSLCFSPTFHSCLPVKSGVRLACYSVLLAPWPVHTCACIFYFFARHVWFSTSFPVHLFLLYFLSLFILEFWVPLRITTMIMPRCRWVTVRERRWKRMLMSVP